MMTCLHCIPPPAAFLEALFSVPYSLSCTPLLLVLLYPPFPWTTTSMQMTLNSSFLFIHPPDFDSSITHLQNSLQQISSWMMTLNLLTLNSSKTEFLLIGLTKQLAKIHNSSLNTTHSARNLGFIFDEHLTFSDQISSVSKSCYYHIRQLRCIRPYLDSKTASTIAASIVHSKLDYCNSLYHNLPKSQIARLQQIQNSLSLVLLSRLPKPVTSLPSCALFTGSK